MGVLRGRRGGGGGGIGSLLVMVGTGQIKTLLKNVCVDEIQSIDHRCLLICGWDARAEVVLAECLSYSGSGGI